MPRMWSANSRKHGAMPILRYSHASRLQDVGNTRSGNHRSNHHSDSATCHTTVGSK